MDEYVQSNLNWLESSWWKDNEPGSGSGFHVGGEPIEVKAAEEKDTIQREQWFETQPLDASAINRIDTLQLVTKSAAKSLDDKKLDGLWTWFELRIRGKHDRHHRKLPKGQSLAWFSHSNPFGDDKCEWDGDSISVWVAACSAYANDVEDGYLLLGSGIRPDAHQKINFDNSKSQIPDIHVYGQKRQECLMFPTDGPSSQMEVVMVDSGVDLLVRLLSQNENDWTVKGQSAQGNNFIGLHSVMQLDKIEGKDKKVSFQVSKQIAVAQKPMVDSQSPLPALVKSTDPRVMVWDDWQGGKTVGLAQDVKSKAKVLIYQMHAPLSEGRYWEKAKALAMENTFVVVDANDLRDRGFRISRGISWDKTMEDFQNSVNAIIADLLLPCNIHLIVRFGYEGVAWVQPGSKAAEEVKNAASKAQEDAKNSKMAKEAQPTKEEPQEATGEAEKAEAGAQEAAEKAPVRKEAAEKAPVAKEAGESEATDLLEKEAQAARKNYAAQKARAARKAQDESEAQAAADAKAVRERIAKLSDKAPFISHLVPDMAEDDLLRRHNGRMPGIEMAFVAGLAAFLVTEPDGSLENLGPTQVGGAVKRAIIWSHRFASAGFCKDSSGVLNYPEARSINNDQIPKPNVIYADSCGFKDGKWSLFNQVESWQMEVAVETVKTGTTLIENTVPTARYGDLKTADRVEIEGFRSTAAVIHEYLHGKASRPLSIAVFGQPGAGKSFGVKEVIKTVLSSFGKGLKKDWKPIEANLSQFKDQSDLSGIFDDVRDMIISGDIPAVLFDEFDSALDKALGWLKYFLAPMQDGKYLQSGSVRSLGRAIFVFIGGTSSTFEDFTGESMNSKKADESQSQANGAQDLQQKQKRAIKDKQAKKPDFISRLSAHINVAGPNKSDNDKGDEMWIMRRAMLLRSMLERRLGTKDKADKSISVDETLLTALLKHEKIPHGSRSMELLLQMSRLSEGQRFDLSALPSDNQLGMHVELGEFQGDLTTPCFEQDFRPIDTVLYNRQMWCTWEAKKIAAKTKAQPVASDKISAPQGKEQLDGSGEGSGAGQSVLNLDA
ncbi:pathway-specific regulatory nit-4 [Fusarium globosum]|uniref:Pathway-specific regulatory nit-4 n=1 Tax=Fusarium globosum TaxID=78864 RepID=A0A8H6DDQ5_9HYPO|nr:pathway-specific regulatory nit-4 [Fusarium globosum]